MGPWHLPAQFTISAFAPKSFRVVCGMPACYMSNNPIITIQTTITAVICTREFPGGSDGKESTQCRRPGFVPWVRKIPWRREWQPTPVFLPGEFQGQRSLVGYSPWGHKESDTTERLTFSICTRHCDNSLYPLLLLILPPPKKQ